MKQTIITRGMIRNNLVPVGSRVLVHCGQNDPDPQPGTVVKLDAETDTLNIAYDDTDEGQDDLYIPGFNDTVEEELKSYIRVMLVEEEQPSTLYVGEPSSTYMLIDTAKGRVLMTAATMSEVTDYALNVHADKGNIKHLAIVASDNVKRLAVGVTVV